jgi:putative transposase
MPSYRARSRPSTQKTKPKTTSTKRRTRQEPIRKDAVQPMPAELQLYLPLSVPEFIQGMRNEMLGKLSQAFVKALEVFFQASAETVAGPKHQGAAQPGDVYWYGSQPGSVYLKDTKVKLKRPRLRSKSEDREIAIPCYEDFQENDALGEQLGKVILEGISTRQYEKVLPAMIEAAGMSRSSVSRHLKDNTTKVLEEFQRRTFENDEILAIFVDGVIFAPFHVRQDGSKLVLTLREGGSENATVVAELLRDLVSRGVRADQNRLFVIDGGKALRRGITEVFGNQPVQRCRLHKERNVVDQLPDNKKEEVKEEMRTAWKLSADQGEAKLEKLAQRLEQSFPSVAGSLREGLHEMFTLNQLGLPESLHKSFSSTNVIDSTFSGSRRLTRNVTRWRDGKMVLRWAAASLLKREENFRKVFGYKQLFRLRDALQQWNHPGTTPTSRRTRS